MDEQEEKTPLQWLLTIAILTILVGTSIAMIFGNTSEVPNILEQFQNSYTNDII